jgi:Protein of unknown function (DUF3617)
MNKTWNLASGAIVSGALTLAVLVPANAQDAVQGVLWETTAQAEIPGMPMKMPAYTAKYCSKEEWTQPPETSKDSSQNCRHTSFEQTPAKVTWTMICDNPPMTGDGEITFNGTDAYTGFVKMNAEQMSMQINLTGTKVGTCDNPE